MSRRVLQVPAGDLVVRARELLASHRLAAIVAHDEGQRLRVVYTFLAGPPDDRTELVVSLDADHPAVPSLAEISFPAGRFERAMHDGFGIEPVGHPALRSLAHHGHWPADYHPMRRGAPAHPTLGSDDLAYPFTAVEGPGVYEIPVGPVHAGLIEPGHFRFSVVGETILKMTPRLWFVQRGLERLGEGRRPDALLELAERVSGDSAVTHGLAATLAIEEATGQRAGHDAWRARVALLELERATHHIVDIGAIVNDTGFSVVQARALALSERLQRHGAELTGHRLLRGVITPGGGVLRAPLDAALYREVGERLADLVDLATSNTVVADRLAGTAVLGADDARRLGVVGVVARASGVAVDARISHPLTGGTTMRIGESGDVRARFDQRVVEAEDSLERLVRWAEGEGVDVFDAGPSPDGDGLGVVEGWRGMAVHRVSMSGGRVARWSVTDPSFGNWPALAVALRHTIVPDFPLANKSFNLSYAGNDL